MPMSSGTIHRGRWAMSAKVLPGSKKTPCRRENSPIGFGLSAIAGPVSGDISADCTPPEATEQNRQPLRMPTVEGSHAHEVCRLGGDARPARADGLRTGGFRV